MTFSRDKEIEEVYNLHREYMQHEDMLINHRTTWLITIQSFLLATFGFAFLKRFEVAAILSNKGELSALGSIATEYKTFLVILAIVGAATSFIAMRSIKAAMNAIRALESNWEKLIILNPCQYLPGITGGGNKDSSKHGVFLSMWVPIFLLALWLLVLFLLLFAIDVQIIVK